MKSLSVGVALCFLALTTAVSAAESKAPEADTSAPEVKRIHPGDTALSQDKNGKWQYKSFPQLATLYVSGKDADGKSTCDIGCTQTWPPLTPTQHKLNEKIGDWKVIAREDGRMQWTYKGKAVYQRFHNLPASESELQRENFQILEP